MSDFLFWLLVVGVPVSFVFSVLAYAYACERIDESDAKDYAAERLAAWREGRP
jgi:uncharacterized membrane protein